ncbi:diguanylate cyclase [Roseibium suaedae]|uniref:PAS domain S-box-containing protein/diguanylate cyclase (GGDEF) domain-containing protein n=1 Tax=Roseibium suaedae TaxID=735517 RepID=A0A1M7J1G0_9HYPH|nr:diguanylate cyclase [Roseibium suaedae]SHM46869.1 PAS domain S-box-containing protein/diguanylate cyclase (GGDEF) domain-containing protein [Roseibium suaedae]
MSTDNLISGIHLDLEKTFGAMFECVIILRPDRRILFVNRAAEQLFGYSLSELIGKTGEPLYANPEDFAAAGKIHEEAAHNRDGQKFVMQFKNKQGRIFHVETITTPLFDATSRHVGYMLMGRDITYRRKLEAMVENSLQTLEDAIETISEAFALYDNEDKLVTCNENYRKTYPNSAPAMVRGTSFEDILRFGLDNGQYHLGSGTKEDWLEERLRWHRKASGEVIEQRLGDGRWLRVSERKTRTGGTAGIRTDITELKESQHKLAAVYENIKLVTNSLACSIVEVDRDGICLFINEHGAAWHGCQPSALIGTCLRDRYPDQDRSLDETCCKEALNGATLRREISHKLSDGSIRDLEIDFTPKRDASGDIIGVIVFSKDISGRKRVERTLAELYQVTSTRDLSSDEKVNHILKIGCDYYNLPLGVISHIEGESYCVKWVECPSGEIEPGLTLPLGETYCSHTLRATGPLAIAHAAESEISGHPCYERFSLEAYIGAPILVDGVRFGTICFTSHTPRPEEFTQTDKEIIRQFSDWIGTEIARQRDHKALLDAQIRLERIASIDDLTAALNRRAFLERAETEVSRFRRTGKPFSVVVLDIDHFKQINDTFGHSTGDEVLRRFSSILIRELRAVDVLGRIGGEEFCIILNDTGPDDALRVCDRLRGAVTEACRMEGMEWDVTCSMGIMSASLSDLDFGSLMKRADTALYEAKHNGRNQCVVYSPVREVKTAHN